MKPKLTQTRLEAIIEALTFRLAGEMGDEIEDIPPEAYDLALDWAIATKRERAQRNQRRKQS
jgi:hypothetical protein